MFKRFKKKKIKESATHPITGSSSSSSSLENQKEADESSSCDESYIYETHPLKDDIYGHAIPNETPELIRSKLDELNEELESIPVKMKGPWLMALEKCPEFCGDSFRLMFLRCELFIVSVRIS